jgi:hypothetical protein
MNVGRTVFSQLLDFIPHHKFRAFVQRYHGNRRVRHFTCWEHFLCLAFAQLTYRESLRDIEACLRSLDTQLYHCGIRSTVSRSTLADANEKRPWQIYRDIALVLIERARELYSNETFVSELDSSIYAFDSTTIDLCLSLFPWAHGVGPGKTKGGVKLHTLLDVRANIPTFIRVSNSSLHDVNVLDEIPYEHGALYIFDRGYVDFQRLKDIDNVGSFFVIRAKRNLQCSRIYSRPVDKSTGIRADQIIRLDIYKSQKEYPDQLRRVKYYDKENKRILVFLTNNFVLDAVTIAELYRSRWKIELFFKWIKQYLRIKSFYGTSQNAVRTQVWIATSIYVLVAIVKKELGIEQSLYTILQILSVRLFEKTTIFQLLTETEILNHEPCDANQLKLFNF